MNKNITYGQWLITWLNLYKKPFIASWKAIQSKINLHIPRYIKESKFSLLNVVDIQKALNNVKGSRTRLDIYDIYHGSLDMAFKVGLTSTNLSSLLVKPKHDRKNGSALTKNELQDFLEIIKHNRCRYYFEFLLLTGVRRNEGLSVTWEDIDFSNKLIHIRGTKTKKSDRFIPLFSELYPLLDSLPVKKGKIFHHKSDYVTKNFKKCCPNHKLHDLRHTFATRCLECGIVINVVSLWLGHSRLETTSLIYTHILPDFVRSESEKFKLL